MAKTCCDILIQCLGRQSSDGCFIKSACENAEETAVLFVDTLYGSERNDMKLRRVLRGIYLANNWKPNFAQAVFGSLRKAIETRRPMGNALRLIYHEVSSVVGDNAKFKEDPPTFHAVMALGILMVESPGIVSDLGGLTEGRILEGENILPIIRSQTCRNANVQARIFCDKLATERY